jgi:Protein of unknown function (DUF1761)
MNLYAPVIAGFAYFLLGGLWFTPLFGKAWNKAVGFNRPPKWRPTLPYYLGPLIGCNVSAFAMCALLHLTGATTLRNTLFIGVIAGLGFSACVTFVNAISPNVPRPALYAAVVGSYHLCGVVLCAAILHWLSGGHGF